MSSAIRDLEHKISQSLLELGFDNRIVLLNGRIIAFEERWVIEMDTNGRTAKGALLHSIKCVICCLRTTKA